MKNALLVLLAATGLIGVGRTTRQGLYESAQAEGWMRVESDGVTFFHPPSLPLTRGYVSFSTPQKDELFMAIYFPGRATVFEKEEIQLIPHDGAPAQTIAFPSGPIALPATSDFTM